VPCVYVLEEAFRQRQRQRRSPQEQMSRQGQCQQKFCLRPVLSGLRIAWAIDSGGGTSRPPDAMGILPGATARHHLVVSSCTSTSRMASAHLQQRAVSSLPRGCVPETLQLHTERSGAFPARLNMDAARLRFLCSGVVFSGLFSVLTHAEEGETHSEHWVSSKRHRFKSIWYHASRLWVRFPHVWYHARFFFYSALPPFQL
jgi:hypothetical protein